MAYIELKRIKGRLYKYARTSRWVNGKSVHSSKYISPVEPVREHSRKRKPGGGRKPALFVGDLKKTEREAIENALSSASAFTKERARVILASSNGRSVNEIASAVGKEVRSVRAAIKAFNISGLACLDRGKTTGRKPVFDAEKRAIILSLASSNPAIAGEAFTTWSLPKLKRSLERKGMRISIESIRRIFRKEKFRIRKSRKFQYSKDPDFVKKNSKSTS